MRNKSNSECEEGKGRVRALCLFCLFPSVIIDAEISSLSENSRCNLQREVVPDCVEKNAQVWINGIVEICYLVGIIGSLKIIVMRMIP